MSSFFLLKYVNPTNKVRVLLHSLFGLRIADDLVPVTEEFCLRSHMLDGIIKVILSLTEVYQILNKSTSTKTLVCYHPPNLY